MTPVDISPRAEAELLEIAGRLAEFGPQAALAFVDTFSSVIDQLRDFPELGQASRRIPHQRVLRRGVYRFVYEFRDGTVLLLGILDGRGQRELP